MSKPTYGGKPEYRTPGKPSPMKYRQASAPGKPSKAYVEGWDRVFGKKTPALEQFTAETDAAIADLAARDNAARFDIPDSMRCTAREGGDGARCILGTNHDGACCT